MTNKIFLTDQYVADKINSWDYQQEPWEHCIDENFFPVEYYKELRKAINSTKTGSKGSPPSREFQDIIDVKASTDCVDFWNDWCKVFESQKVQTALLNKFNITEYENFNNIRTDIHKCEAGFTLNKHNDTKYDIHNAYIVGLQIYVPVNDGRDDEGCWLSSADETKSEVLIPYKENLAWSFSSTLDTFHHVPKCTGTRHSIIMKYCIIDPDAARKNNK